MKDIEEKRSAVLVDQITDLNEQLANLRAQKTYEQGVKDGIEFKEQKLYMDGYHMATQHMNGILTHTPTNEVVNNGE